MNPLFGIALFGFVLTMTFGAGYVFTRFASPANATGGVREGMIALLGSLGDRVPAASRDRSPYRQRLALAGFREPQAVRVYYGVKCAAALLLAAVLGILSVFLNNSFTLPVLPMLCGAGFGYMIVDRLLASRVQARAYRIRSALPATLDLMILGLESGQSLDAALTDVGRALRSTFPEMTAELAQLHVELRAGSSRTEAFRNLATRNGEPELRKVCNLLIDSDRFGTPLGAALRSHAKYLRTRFRQHAQESARKIGVKLIFPVFFLIFPYVLLVTLGPAVMMMMQQLKSLLG